LRVTKGPRVGVLLAAFGGLFPMRCQPAACGAVPMALLVIVAFRHALDGVKVVVDDYVHEPGNNFALNVLLLFLAVGGGAIALYAIARIAFGAVA
jgi:succinate dehydrogenase / fumarate reductase, membrane anchor subunit